MPTLNYLVAGTITRDFGPELAHMRPSHITLIRPPGSSSRHAYSVGVVPPLGLAYVTAALEAAGYQVTAVDSLALAPVRRWQSPPPTSSSTASRPGETIARPPPDFDAITITFSWAWLLERRSNCFNPFGALA